ncbi:glycosyltransferase family 2 protein [Sphingomonas sp. PB2P19]|uniref:glycosyltransferase family 2 protein n=1 Tax=Sphingomonas rhamnosi TaxID=3096156 RepID=UPI002FCB4A4C
MNQPGISVIVPTFNDSAASSRCIAALKQQDYAGEIEIIVVDNGSLVPPTVPRDVTLLVERKPGSYNGRNCGMAAARHDIFAFTDADCRPHPQWLTNGVAALQQINGVGLVGGRIVTVVDGAGVPTIPELFEVAIAFPQDTYIAHGRYAATANMITTRETMERIGPFDGRLMSGGDKDWGCRVAAAGLALIYAADACVDHPARGSHDDVRRKVRRIVGGERDRRPSWRQASVFMARHMLPPRTRIGAVLRLHDVPFGRRLLVACYCVLINWTYAFDRLALQLRKSASER